MSRGSTVARALPNLDTLIHYDRGWLRDDVIAGVTVAAYLIPQVMGYSQVAGLPAFAGLWAILASLTVYAIVGSSRQLSVGPESTTALMTASVIGSMAAGDPVRYAALASALALIVGAIAFVSWAVRLGFLADLLSKPVLVGYMAGVACVMIVSQLGKITGVRVDGQSTIDQARSFFGNVDQTNLPTLVLGVTTLAFFFLVASTRLPGPLIGVVLSVLAVAVFSLDDHGVAVIGAIPSGLPIPRWPAVSARDLVTLIFPALGIAVVGYSDNMLTARAFGTRHGQVVDANQEWLALGAANAGAGLLRGLPVSSSGSRTAVGDSVGSKTQLHSLVAAAAVALTLLFAGSLLARFPVATLGAIVVYAALRLIDVAEFRRLFGFQRAEFAIAVVAAIGVIAVGALYGVLLAVSLSIIQLVRRVARPHDGILGFVPGVAGMHDIDDYPDAKLVPGLLVYRYDAPLFFVNADDFKRRALAALAEVNTPVEWFLLNAEANVGIDITAIDALDELHRELAQRDIVFAMARVKQDLLVQLDRAGFTDRVDRDRIFATLPTAVQAFAEWYETRHGQPPPGLTIPDPPPALET
ncbi:MAG: sulfate permease, SulP family [Ilumatobacteraceae bacterium]